MVANRPPHRGQQPQLGVDGVARSRMTLSVRVGKLSADQRFGLNDADWQRARWELWYANAVMTAGQVPSANQWTTIQRGLDELLVSPAVKRRAGIELRRRGVDADVVAAGEMLGKYKRSLKSV
jgi:hypothetical protein